MPIPYAAWWKASRFHFVPPSFLPAILGAIAAWTMAGVFSLWYFILTVIGVTVNHICLNMTDDYFDYRHSADSAPDTGKNPYSGGSGVLVSGLIRPEQMRAAFTSGYLFTIVIGVYLTIKCGWPVALFGMFGVGCSYFYTAPPIRYAYHGWGELSQLVNFSITIGLGSYYVQAGSLSTGALLAVLPLGFMMFSMITVNEIPDESNDGKAGKKTLVVRAGARNGVLLYSLGMCAAYAVIVIAPLVGAVTYWSYLGLATIPWFLKSMAILKKNYNDPIAMSPANIFTIRIHNITGVLLITALLIDGLMRRGAMAGMIAPFFILAVLYAPVAMLIFKKSPLQPEPGA